MQTGRKRAAPEGLKPKVQRAVCFFRMDPVVFHGIKEYAEKHRYPVGHVAEHAIAEFLRTNA